MGKEKGIKGNPMLKYKHFVFPAFLGILIIFAVLFEYVWETALPFDFSIISLIVAGGYVIKSTVEATIELKKVTAGILVVFALIGTTYVGEYLAGAIVAFMMIFGEFLEEVTLEKTKDAVRDLIKFVPNTCRKKISNEYKVVPLYEIEVGDYVQVIPGERIPVDGIIIAGQAAINEASITGESMPVDKTSGDQVYVGSLNETGVIEVKTEKIGSDTVLGKIIKTVHMAQNNKGDAQKAADEFAKYFVPIIVVICIAVWFMTKDIMRVMTILVIACPCALVLATPTAVVASVGNAAKKGILIKGGVVIENSAKVTVVCLDKTGTITKGKPKVVDFVQFNNWNRREVIETAAMVEKNSQHPIGKAIVEFIKKDGTVGMENIPDAEFEMLFGRGVKVKFNEALYEVSNKKVLKDHIYSQEIKNYLESQEKMGRTALAVIKNGSIIGALAVADTIRDTAKSAIEGLKGLGLKRIIMLTGDNEAAAKTISEEVGITEFRANLLPEDKLDIIRKLQSQGEVVAMIGDGVNDAPALVLSDVGIAMGAVGTDVAIEAANIALMSDNIELLAPTFALSRRTYKIIKQNIWFFSVVVNIVGVYFSGMGWLNPIIAAIIHNASSVFVVINSSRLLTYK